MFYMLEKWKVYNVELLLFDIFVHPNIIAISEIMKTRLLKTNAQKGLIGFTTNVAKTKRGLSNKHIINNHIYKISNISCEQLLLGKFQNISSP